jgi:hypothetical protein
VSTGLFASFIKRTLLLLADMHQVTHDKSKMAGDEFEFHRHETLAGKTDVI